MITNLQKAYVIHSRPYKETSLIVTFLTKDKGKITAVAKGAKRRNSRLSGNLEPFQCLNIDYRGKSDLKSLILAEPCEVFEDFFGSENLYSAFYVNELINYLTAQADESIEIFDLYKKCISNLKKKNTVEEILRDFELKILSELGYEINFLSEYGSNEPITEGLSYKYAPQSGFIKSAKGYDGNILKEIIKRKFSKNSLKACKEINRATIDYYFEELNIKSRIFFK
ncbi:MAG: DNA repair protein RecO [Gammaproteobacteria bacterium TMED112]|nr:MAG: DNA repair protein RecO [Gammaproteobacteria bacterium TMED112]|tara:strand:+ start:3607 stop:4284 length:678 start_codon:yes stop_codon:yes gene_type:complete